MATQKKNNAPLTEEEKAVKTAQKLTDVLAKAVEKFTAEELQNMFDMLFDKLLEVYDKKKIVADMDGVMMLVEAMHIMAQALDAFDDVDSDDDNYNGYNIAYEEDDDDADIAE